MGAIFFFSFSDEISLCKQNNPRWDACTSMAPVFIDLDMVIDKQLQLKCRTLATCIFLSVPWWTLMHRNCFRMFEPSIVSYLTAINGRSYANLEGLNMCQGDAVAWHILAVGANEALHGIKFNGNNILTNGVNRDSYIAVPGGTFTGLMHAENVGMYPVFRNTSVIDIKKVKSRT